jgi:hypothetical protein
MLDPRTRLSVEIALTADRHEEEARALGLCGAEIDALRAGRSFDARVSLAVALALADEGMRPALRAKAARAGLDAAACREIEALAARGPA